MDESLRIEVAFETTEDPIAGSLRKDGAERRFTGWLGLIAGLQEAAGVPKPSEDDDAEAAE